MDVAQRFRRIVPWIAIALVTLVFFQLANQFDYTPRRNRPGPDLWPKLVLVLSLATCLAGALAAWFGGGADREADLAAVLANRREDGPAETATSGRLPLALAGMAAMVAYVPLLPAIGFLPATFLLMYALIRIGGYRREPLGLSVAALGALGFFFMFQRVVYVSLPLGWGPFREFSIAAMALMGIR